MDNDIHLPPSLINFLGLMRNLQIVASIIVIFPQSLDRVILVCTATPPPRLLTWTRWPWRVWSSSSSTRPVPCAVPPEQLSSLAATRHAVASTLGCSMLTAKGVGLSTSTLRNSAYMLCTYTGVCMDELHTKHGGAKPHQHDVQ